MDLPMDVHAPWTNQYGTDVSSFCIHRGFTLARCTHRAHIPAPAFAPFSPSRGETRLLTFPFLPIDGQVQRQAQPLHRAAPVSYRGPGVGRGRLPRRRDPLARRRLVPRATGARARRRARRPGQPHAQRPRGRRGVHGRVSRARRAQGTRHRPEDEAPELSVDAKFSFVLIDKVNGRVFAASTALSSPLALGHATDGAFKSRTVTSQSIA